MNKRMTGNGHWQGGSRQVAIAGAVLTMLMINGSVIADPIQWTEAEGGNGHWYEQVAAGGVITWADAKVAAEQLGGHLVTLGSLEENLFISQLPLNGETWLGATDEPSETWRWVTGEAWTYTAWNTNICHPSNQPDNASGDEDCLKAMCKTEDGWYTWSDFRGWQGGNNFVVEWDADCNDDGIVDYGQILDGTYADNDGNGVPDCCDDGEPCDSVPSDSNHVLELNNWPDAAVIPHHSSITPLDAMTIEFWIQADGLTGRAITKRPGNGGCYTVEANHDDVGCDAHVSIFGSCLSSGWGEIPCSWTHLAVTVDGASGTTRTYENGVLVGEGVLGSECTIGQGSWDLRFGNTNGYSSTQFVGRLDNIRIWNAPLSENDIRHWMVTDITPEIAATLPDLGGSWNFENGVADATGINNGWLEGGAVLVEDQSIIMDCNGNMIPDSQDIADGSSTDYNTNDVPDDCECLADLDQDGEVAVSDLLTVIAQWGNDDSGLGDINHDGAVGVNDVLYALNSWGPCP